MAEPSMRTFTNVQLFQELEALSQTIDQPQTTRRAASLVLPRLSTSNADPLASTSDNRRPADDAQSGHGTRSRRTSMMLWRSRPKSQPESDTATTVPTSLRTEEKKGIWSWKPMRALSHIGMQRLGCLFSVEVISVQGLPATMNGLRLCVAIRKKETKDGAVQTLPSRVLQGSADFEETLFIRCHVYCSGRAATSKPLRFEPRPFIISAVAVDAPELELGKSVVDLSQLVRESVERSLEGMRIRQWDVSFELSGMAKGGKLAAKLGFQIMEDTSVGIYSQVERLGSNKGRDPSSWVARKQSKSSFSLLSPSKRMEPSQLPPEVNNDFNLDEPDPPPPSGTTSIQKSELELQTEELDLLEFDVIDKGIEIPASKAEKDEVQFEEVAQESSVSSEIVKEVVQDRARLMELDSIAKQIKELESMMTGDGISSRKTAKESETPELDADEEMVTREFLQMLELTASKQRKNKPDLVAALKTGAEEGSYGEEKVFVSDLGKGLGSVVQTRDGGYLASMNPFNVEVARNETPKLTMQISRPFMLRDHKLATGFELFQRLAAIGSEELVSKLLSLTAMDELKGKTAEQIAFEGIASAIISGRNMEGASSSAARSIAIAKTMATSLHEGRRERIARGTWNVKEDPVAVEEILAFSLQKIEAMALEALKIQADVAEVEAPFDVSPLIRKEDSDNPLESAILTEDWDRTSGSAEKNVTLLAVIQLRDPFRRYEAVGAPAIAVVQATRVENCEQEEETRLKVTSLHLGGMKLSSGATRNAWDGEKQRLTAVQWLVAYGLGKTAKKNKPMMVKEGRDLVWSLSSRVMADMWLKPMRNPDVKISNQKSLVG